MSEITDRSRRLRKKSTDAERILWERIRSKRLGIKFRRQHPVIFFENNKRHCFIADFVNLESKVIIELDGEIHNSQKEYDNLRDHSLDDLGYIVHRFSNKEIMSNLNVVLNKIKTFCSLPHVGEGGSRSDTDGGNA